MEATWTSEGSVAPAGPVTLGGRGGEQHPLAALPARVPSHPGKQAAVTHAHTQGTQAQNLHGKGSPVTMDRQAWCRPRG